MGIRLDNVGFEGMSATERALYLSTTFKTGINLSRKRPVSGEDIVHVFETNPIPVDEDGFIDGLSLLYFVYRQLHIPRERQNDDNGRVEEVINVLLAVDMLVVQLESRGGMRDGYQLSQDTSMLRAVLSELNRMSGED